MGQRADAPAEAGGAWRVARWSLWSLPARALAYVLLVDSGAAVALSLAAFGPVPARSWGVAGVLVACAFAHLHFSRWIERVRRDHSHLPHVDLCSIWIFAGALVLPPLPAVLLVVAIYLHRWWVVGRWDTSRPPHRCVFTVSMMILAALSANGVAHASGLREHLLAGTPSGPLDLLGVVGAAAAQWGVNSLLVGVVIAITVTLRRIGDAVGSAGDNLLEVGQLALGAFVALAVAWWPGFALPMVVAAVALHRTVLIHQLELAARTDHKTGLLNAESWHLQARLELQRTRDRQTPSTLGLFMIDVDHFKDINDRYGHQVGDAVLREIAEAVSGAVRRGDSVGRFGGEEFAVLLPMVERAEALVVAERVRARVFGLKIDDCVDGTVTGLGVSIGVAIWPEIDEDTLEGVLAAADSALYEAKRLGRDQVRLAGAHRRLRGVPSARQSPAAD